MPYNEKNYTLSRLFLFDRFCLSGIVFEFGSKLHTYTYEGVWGSLHPPECSNLAMTTTRTLPVLKSFIIRCSSLLLSRVRCKWNFRIDENFGPDKTFDLNRTFGIAEIFVFDETFLFSMQLKEINKFGTDVFLWNSLWVRFQVSQMYLWGGVGSLHPH
jgi:hypothetical protein